MISVFVKEQKRYTQEELFSLLHCSVDKSVSIIRKLKEFSVLKEVRATDLQRDKSELLEEDIEVADVETDGSEYFYIFTFVGIIVISGIVLKCYPKYLPNDCQPNEELRQIVKVIEKTNAKEQTIRLFNDNADFRTFNILAVLLFLLQDYYEYGTYRNSEDTIESNGSGEILWNKTINETFMMLSDNRPYYFELQTRKRVDDTNDYFKRLHECIVTKASKELLDAELLDIFGISEVDLTDEKLEDFGEKEYILYRIEKELNVQFNTRKQLILKAIFAYVAHGGSLLNTDSFSLIGTNSFNLVWENVCADILDNKLHYALGSLELPIPLCSDYDSGMLLCDLIEKPLWTAAAMTASETLIPDIITITKSEKDFLFIIFDAKYYTPRLKRGVTPQRQPGIESITKQYLYQLSYQKFINEHAFTRVSNCFLLPTKEERIIDGGEVKLQMLADFGLQNIKVRFIPARLAYECYISGEKLDINSLSL